jgi:hypothetical protein
MWAHMTKLRFQGGWKDVLFLFTSCRRFKFGNTDASFYVEPFCA